MVVIAADEWLMIIDKAAWRRFQIRVEHSTNASKSINVAILYSSAEWL